MITLRIHVTKDILERSKKCDNSNFLLGKKGIGSNCAIALAVREIWPSAWVESYGIIPFYHDDPRNKYPLRISVPRDACKFIMQFDTADADERVQMPELSFDIQVPDQVINEINIDEILAVISQSPTLELVTA